jgi:branched-chain amino acid transport system ATP-binding protein
LKQAQQSMLIVDKNINELSQIADRHYVVEKGRVVWSGSNTNLKANPTIVDAYLGV